ncbi:heme ABC transporter ATP-binding protein [bacterium]|nr:heme ABC transporter ATP-binding protein [bacterium]
MLSANGVTFSIRSGRELVSNVSLSAEPGRLMAVLGPNGAGKTTLLRLLTGELMPTGGSVELDGVPLARSPQSDRACKVAVMRQSTELSFPYPAFDVAMFGRHPHHRTSSLRKDRRIVWDCLKRTASHHLAERSYPTLSGGEKQRVQLARVLAQLEDGEERLDGKVMLLDEPTSALDLAHQHQVLTVAREMAQRGAAVLAILHDLNLAAQYADRLLVLHDGQVAAQGPASEVLVPSLIEHVYRVRADVQPHPVHGVPFVCTTGCPVKGALMRA